MALDFSGQNLRGRNFKGRQDLAGANFSYTDIRGTNFINANLRGANFSHAKAGLQLHSIIVLVLTSLLVSTISGFFFPYFGASTISLLISRKDPAGLAVIVILAVFFIFLLTIRQSVLAALIVIALGAALVGMGAMSTSLAASVIVTVVVVVAAVEGRAAMAAAVTSAVMAAMTAIVIVYAKAGALVGYGAAIATVVTVGLSLYMSLRTLAEDEKYIYIRMIGIACGGDGTSFRSANLTDANFTQAILKSTNFTNANLTRTCWFQAQKLDFASVWKTYLDKSLVRQLVVTREGQDKNFDNLSLRGVNLCGANLADASFIGADLSEANLQDTDLSRAKLKQTQLDGTDLTGATLTGAYIEDWGITNTTKLHGVRCEYVFMRLPTKEDPDPLRKPDNKQEVFADGDFADFIKPIFDTLDLYHNQGIDPRAVAIAFKNLAENHPEAELEIVAMEKRGDDKILLRAKTAVVSDKSLLSAEYFDDYNQLKALSQSQQLLLVEKDKRIISLENMVDTALKQPKFYTQGDTNMSDISGISIQGSSNVSGIAGNNSIANLGTISGNVSIALNELPDAPDAEKPGIKELLSQLQDAIIQSTYLPEEDKAEALEQVKALAEAGKNPQESTKQKTAKTAITMLKGIFTGLPVVASVVEAANKLLPTISKLFGLG
ncbi:MAG: pentapeptide repeat-containing protein [Nostoc sp.]|uniref:pentapeptide repeat-containing protein n=1 Tax=Nostoc sp. TaxID=1180 RepID=UPI002FF7B8CC